MWESSLYFIYFVYFVEYFIIVLQSDESTLVLYGSFYKVDNGVYCDKMSAHNNPFGWMRLDEARQRIYHLLNILHNYPAAHHSLFPCWVDFYLGFSSEDEVIWYKSQEIKEKETLDAIQ